MGRIFRTSTILANASNPDQLQLDGLQLADRVAKANGPLSFAATQSAIGLSATVSVNKTVVGQSLNPFISATAPQYPDNLLVDDGIMMNEILALTVDNATAGPIVLFYAYQIP